MIQMIQLLYKLETFVAHPQSPCFPFHCKHITLFPMSESPSLSIFSQRYSDSGFMSVVEPSPNLPSNRWIKRSVNQFFQPRPLLLMPATGSATGGLFLLMIPPGAARRLLCLLWIKFRRVQRDSFFAFCVFCGSNSAERSEAPFAPSVSFVDQIPICLCS